MSRRLSLADCNPKFLERNRAEIEQQTKSRAIGIERLAEVEAAPQERRMRQSAIKLNALETDYQDVLHMKYGKDDVVAQSIRVRLASGAWFKCDFFVKSERLFIECKGPHSFRGGFEFLKVAASIHTWAKFRLVWRVSGQWKFQEVLQ